VLTKTGYALPPSEDDW